MQKIRTFLNSSKGFSLAELIIYLGILGLSAGVFSGILTTVTETQVDEFAENEISGQLNFSIQTIQRLIKSSSIIQNEAGTASSSLSLLLPDPALSPTRIYLENKKIYIKQGNNIAQPLTNERVTVDSLEFKKFIQPGAKDVVHFDIALSLIEPSTGEKISHSLNSAVSRVSAASFDDSLIPNTDASYNIGSATYRWKDGFFSGDVSAGNLCLGGTCKSTWGQVAGVTGSGTVGRVARWTASDTLGNSTLYDTGSTIGIGVINPTLALEVNGAGSFSSGIGAGTSSLDPNYKIITSGGGIKAENSSATPAGYFNSTGGGYAIQTGTGNVLLGSLAGTGNRNVIVDSNGVLSATSSSGGQWAVNGSSLYYNSGNIGIGTSTPAAKLDVRGGQIIGGFGAQGTGGTLDWNDISNARPGNGYSLMRGDATNGPVATSNYFHSFGFEYGSTKDGTGNITQLAIPYSDAASVNAGVYIRGRYSGTWSTWRKILSEGGSGSVSIGTTTTDGNYKLILSGGGIKSESTSQPAGYFSSTSGYGLLVNGGNVGIGNTNPGHKLDISGAYYSRLISKGSCSGSVTINWNDGNTQHCTLTGNITFSFTNGSSGGNYRLILKQGGSGNYSVTWPASVRWAGGSAQVPTLTGNVGRSDYVGFFYNGVDSTYDGVAFTANVY